ncbi:MAG TPA: MFS transporter [Mycobacteriales bacterium]|nr:MFS transporter [Mycobacteriales bacterium]
MALLGLGPHYRHLWSANLLSALGGGLSGAAMPLLAASLTDSPGLVSGVAVAGELPWFAFGLVAGAVVDRLDRRRLVLLVALIRAGITALLIAAIVTDRASIPLIYLIAAAGSLIGIFGGTARTTLTPLVVPREDLGRANSRLASSGDAAANVVGPPLGSTAFALLAAAPFGIGMVLSLLSAGFIGRLPAPPARTPDRRSGGMRQDIAEGLRWLAGHRRLRTIVLLTAVLAATDSAWFSLLVLYARDVLGLSSGAYGWIVGGAAAGGLVGSLAATRLSARFGVARCLIWALLVAAAGQLLLGFTADVTATVLSLVSSSLVFGVWNVLTTTLIQTLTPDHLLGRVVSAERTVVMGASPLGALLGGIAATGLGLHAPFLLGAPLLLGAVALGRRAVGGSG